RNPETAVSQWLMLFRWGVFPYNHRSSRARKGSLLRCSSAHECGERPGNWLLRSVGSVVRALVPSVARLRADRFSRPQSRSRGKGDPAMLVLSRKENEKILFPHLGIALQVLRVNGGKVRLGLEAPDDVSIVRYEIASADQIAEFTHRLTHSTTKLNHEARNR